MINREPEMYHGIPDWCHMQGRKIYVSNFDIKNLTLVLGRTKVASITIERSISASGEKNWRVTWKICHESGVDTGNRPFSDQDLKSAFALSENSGKYGDWLIQRYGADVASQGMYIRYGNYLNIPGPGTGYDGDANVSIHLDDEIKIAIQELLHSANNLYDAGDGLDTERAAETMKALMESEGNGFIFKNEDKTHKMDIEKFMSGMT